MRLTLRTLLAYLDDTLPPAEARQIGLKVAENPPAQDLVEKIKRVTRRRGLSTPPTGNEGSPSDPNTVAEFLSDALPTDQVAAFEKTCLESDVHLAEVSSCHQILTLVLSEQVRVPPSARRRMYHLVKGRESLPDRKPGRTIPVGGVLEDHRPPAADDTDAPYLLGMSAYSRTDSWSRTATRFATLALLLLALGFALWMAIPSAVQPRTEEPSGGGGFAAIPPARVEPAGNSESVKPADKSDAKPADQGETKPTDKGETKPADKGEARPPDKAEPKSPEAIATVETAPTPRLPGEPLASDVLAPQEPPPRPDRVQIGRLEKPTEVVVRHRSDGWVRVPPEDPMIISGERLIALPGYNKAVIKLETDVSVELWSNLRELFDSPTLMEASVTPHLPGDGFHADLTVHVGRIYLTSRRPGSAKVRVRVRNQVWDLELKDNKSEVVIEVGHTLVPSARDEPPRTTVGLAVLAGEVALRPSRYKQAVTLPRGGDAFWDSKTGPPAVRPDPGEEVRKKQVAYLSRLQPSFDPSQAKLAVEALADFSRKLTDGSRVRATFDEALQDRTDAPPAPKDVEAARIAVLVFAALGDLPGLADAISDPNRPLLRTTAIEGLRSALARDPALAEPFRQTLVDKLQIEDGQADSLLRMLRGFTDEERVDPAVLDRLVAGLSAPAVAVRDLSFQHLLGYIDRMDRANETLLRYEAGAPSEYRESVVQAWRKKAEEIKKKLAEPPQPEPKK